MQKIYFEKNYIKIAILFSFFYSLFFNFTFQENVFISNLFEYHNNSINNPVFLTYLYNSQSILVGLALLLKKIGINYLFLHLLFNFILTTISFFSIYYLSKIFLKSDKYCLIIPIIFIPFNFLNTRFYGIDFPSDFFNFGQFGFYSTLLSMSLLILKQYKISILMLIFCIFCNPVWGIINLGIFVTIFFLEKEKINLKKIANLKIIFFLTLFLIIFIFTLLEINNTKEYVISNNETISKVVENKSSSHEFFKIKDPSNISFLETHNFKLNFNHPSFLFDTFRFICFDLLIFLIFFIYNPENKQEKILINIIFLNILFSYLIVLFQTIETENKTVLYLFDRLSLNRSLNINNVTILVFIIAKIFNKIENNKIFKFSIIFFSVFNFFINLFFYRKTFENYIDYYGKYIQFYDIIIYCLIPFFLIGYKLKKKNSHYVNNNLVIYIIILSFIPFFLNKFLDNKQKILSNYNDSKKIISNVKNNNSNIFLTGRVIGFTNPSSFLKNKTIFMFNPNMFFFNYTDKLKKLFCSDHKKIFREQYNYFNYLDENCYSPRSRKEWEQFAEIFKIGYVITRSNLKLKLDLLSENTDFKIYKIVNK